jgi:hypothetical protein
MSDTARPPSGPWPTTVDALCDRFEAAWQAGERPRLEGYLHQSPQLHRSRLLRELLLLEVYYRQRNGEQPEAHEYQLRFPADPETIAAVFTTADTGHDAAAKDSRRPGDSQVVAPTLHNSGLSPGLGRTYETGGKEPELPEHLGRYRVTGRLGAGGFGVVYRGYDDDLERDVAIKVPHPRRVRSAADAEAYLAEARALAALDHPGIVPVYDLGRTDLGHCYVVSKFIDGEDLARRLARGRLGPAEAVETVARVAEALHHAHRRGITHRDIKTANILIDLQGNPVVVDFGLALREEEFGRDAN